MTTNEKKQWACGFVICLFFILLFSEVRSVSDGVALIQKRFLLQDLQSGVEESRLIFVVPRFSKTGSHIVVLSLDNKYSKELICEILRFNGYVFYDQSDDVIKVHLKVCNIFIYFNQKTKNILDSMNNASGPGGNGSARDF